MHPILFKSNTTTAKTCCMTSRKNIMDNVLLNDDLMRHILSYVIPKCRGGNEHYHRCTDPVENHPGELLSFGVSSVLDNGRTCLRKCARVAFQLRFVSLRWNTLIQDVVISERLPGPAMFWPICMSNNSHKDGKNTNFKSDKIPFVCGGEADLRCRVEAKLGKRREARSLLSAKECEIIDQDLKTCTWDVLQFCGHQIDTMNDYQEHHAIIFPMVQNIFCQLDRGASTEKFLLVDPMDDNNWYFTDVFRFYECSIEKVPPFLWVLFQELACAAGKTRAIPSCLDRSNGHINLPFFQYLIDLVSGYLDISPLVQKSKQYGRRRKVVRRLGLGLARIILHVSALDHLERMNSPKMGGFDKKDLGYLICGDENNMSWSQVWLNRCVLVSPVDSAIDHRFSFELLGCVAVNGLGGTLLPPYDKNMAVAIGKYYDFKDWPFRMHSYIFLRYLHFGLNVFSDVKEFIDTLSIDPTWIKQERLEFSLFISNASKRRDMISTLNGNQKLRRWLVRTACGKELIKELITLKQHECLQALLEKELLSPALQHILPELIEFAKSKVMHDSEDQTICLLKSIKKESMS